MYYGIISYPIMAFDCWVNFLVDTHCPNNLFIIIWKETRDMWTSKQKIRFQTHTLTWLSKNKSPIYEYVYNLKRFKSYYIKERHASISGGKIFDGVDVGYVGVMGKLLEHSSYILNSIWLYFKKDPPEPLKDYFWWSLVIYKFFHLWIFKLFRYASSGSV